MSERASTSTRYDTVIATLVGALALTVSAYTAYVQRQQVRAQVLPLVQIDDSGGEDYHWTVKNKGVGPALIRHVVIEIDGAPVPDWPSFVEQLLGPGQRTWTYSSLAGLVLSPGENAIPWQALKPLADTPPAQSVAVRAAQEHRRVGFEICYCSTLDDCWLAVRPPGDVPSVSREIARCPAPSARSFRQ